MQSSFYTSDRIKTHVCEGSSLSLSCEQDTVINIIRANFGRFSNSVCPSYSRDTTWSTRCIQPTTLRVVNHLCGGKSSCSVPVSSTQFGDPCPYTPKYLELVYKCEENRQSLRNSELPPWLLALEATTVNTIGSTLENTNMEGLSYYKVEPRNNKIMRDIHLTKRRYFLNTKKTNKVPLRSDFLESDIQGEIIAASVILVCCSCIIIISIVIIHKCKGIETDECQHNVYTISNHNKDKHRITRQAKLSNSSRVSFEYHSKLKYQSENKYFQKNNLLKLYIAHQ